MSTKSLNLYLLVRNLLDVEVSPIDIKLEVSRAQGKCISSLVSKIESLPRIRRFLVIRALQLVRKGR